MFLASKETYHNVSCKNSCKSYHVSCKNLYNLQILPCFLQESLHLANLTMFLARILTTCQSYHVSCKNPYNLPILPCFLQESLQLANLTMFLARILTTCQSYHVSCKNPYNLPILPCFLQESLSCTQSCCKNRKTCKNLSIHREGVSIYSQDHTTK